MNMAISQMIEGDVRSSFLCDTFEIFGGSLTLHGREHRKPVRFGGQYCIRFRSFVYPIIDAYTICDGEILVLVPSLNSIKQYKRLR